MYTLVGQRSFAAYDPSHWAVLAVLAAGVVALAWWGGRAGNMRPTPMVDRGLAVLILVFHIPILVYDLTPARFDPENSLPFHLCDLAWMAAVWALWTRNRWACALLYYWGLTLVPQAVITPALDAPGFPSIDFVSFWGQHLIVVWAAVYLTWWVGQRPDWSGYQFTVAITVGWGLLMLGFNAWYGTNYLFVNRKPDNPSALDLLGDWPWYLGAELGVGMAVWALLTWPWIRERVAGEPITR